MSNGIAILVGISIVGGAGLLQAAGEVSFSLTEVAVVTGMLGIVVGAVSFLYRQYVDAEKRISTGLAEQVVYLRAEIEVRNTAQIKSNEHTLEIMQTVVAANKTAYETVSENLRGLERVNAGRIASATKEHETIIDRLADIAQILRGRRDTDSPLPHVPDEGPA